MDIVETSSSGELVTNEHRYEEAVNPSCISVGDRGSQ
jgi:hypothetical protein